MNSFKKLFIFYIYCISFLKSSGRKLNSYISYDSYSSSLDKGESVGKTAIDAYSEITMNYKSPQTEQLFKTYDDMPKEALQKSTLIKNSGSSASKFDSINDKTLEMKVGEHLVKVKSKKESKTLASAPVGGGYNISINPKYSHVIEIIHRGKNLNEQGKSAQNYSSIVEKHQLELPKIIHIDKPKDIDDLEKTVHIEFGEADEGHSEEFSEVGDSEEFSESDGDSDKFSESDGGFDDLSESDGGFDDLSESDSDSDEFSDADGDSDEFSDADGNSDEFSDADGEDSGEFSEVDEGETGEDDGWNTEDLNEDNSKDEEHSEEFSKASEEPSEEFDDSDEEELEEFVVSNNYSEEYPEKLNEVYDRYPSDLDDSKEFESKTGSEMFPPHIKEDIKKISEDTNRFKQNETESEKTTSTIEESALNEEFEGSGEEFSDANIRNNSKTGRILSMFSRQNETFPTCTTPKGEAGRCRKLGECLLSEALNNFNGFLQQLCLIRGARVGICCPDNPVIETVNPDENATSQLKAEDIKQPPEGCGLNTKTRIVGGTISVPHEWTWMVALMRRNRFYCGGVIINNWYILTAAHCVMGMNVKDLTVRLGEYDFNEQAKHIEDLSVSEIKRHAQFVTLTFQHDIALLKLKRSIKYSKFVGSICLPDQKARDYSDVKGTVVGWGTVSFGGAASPVLRQVTVPVWKNEDCDRTYLLESIGDSFMCAGSPEKGEDACQGDSGGPLMTVNESGRWEVIGLVSWGRRCGDPTYPGVYTRVTTYLDWIKQNAV